MGEGPVKSDANPNDALRDRILKFAAERKQQQERFEVDDGFCRSMIPYVVPLLKKHVPSPDWDIRESSKVDDMAHAIDLILVMHDQGHFPTRTVALRMRRFQYLARYADEFTIRSRIPDGRTELAKILQGWGDYIFYGFAAENDKGIAAWLIGDLDVFRSWHRKYTAEHLGVFPGVEKQNVVSPARFTAYKVRELPHEFIVARAKYHSTERLDW